MATIGRPREYDDDRVTKAVRISADLDHRLKEAARQRGVSANLLMNAALEDYLGRLLPVEQVLRTAS
jgi:predicted transcriptional regulator